jgi:hypothetical protein
MQKIIGQIESGRFGLAAELAVNHVTLEVAQDLTEQAIKCVLTPTLRGNMEVKLSVTNN